MYVCNVSNGHLSLRGVLGLYSSPNSLVCAWSEDCRVAKLFEIVIVFDVGPHTRQIGLYGRLDTFSSCWSCVGVRLSILGLGEALSRGERAN